MGEHFNGRPKLPGEAVDVTNGNYDDEKQLWSRFEDSKYNPNNSDAKVNWAYLWAPLFDNNLDDEEGRTSLKSLVVKIMSPDSVEVGSITLLVVNRVPIICGNFSFDDILDILSDEHSNFALELFDEDGYLAPRVETKGSRAFRTGDSHRDLNVMYLNEIVIEEEYRGQGIGQWAIPRMFLMCAEMFQARFIYTMPAILTYLGTSGSLAGSTAEDKMAFDMKKQAIEKFFRKVGFRRVGNSAYFALSKNPNHRSRSVTIEEDTLIPHIPYFPSHGDPAYRYIFGNL